MCCFIIPQGAFTFHGKMIDMPSVLQAKNILQLSANIGPKQEWNLNIWLTDSILNPNTLLCVSSYGQDECLYSRISSVGRISNQHIHPNSWFFRNCLNISRILISSSIYFLMCINKIWSLMSKHTLLIFIVRKVQTLHFS